ncbi:hypothetical protein EHQ61_03495 [Leptospira wolffii]|uniref:Uncharacterized protein n=1 Tax=Leptospira wolffii TaxID=409998 RepID=A0A2M9Z9U1_9LEPT|nr:hypothetical protein LEP1GSC061_2053 [Leptospira wolffii serovar Khorat str. Khorat-H2]PJZ65199.1 hypothetical protein CH371_14885 [Leptospira wolffii]TGL53727.1 hypothetical protein EHQ61_03495 [Leptospira wolffii]
MESQRILKLRSLLFLSFVLILSPSLFSQEQTIPELPVQDPVKPSLSKEEPRIFRYNRLTLQENPLRIPSAIPRDFVLKDSQLLYSTELKSERLLETRESILILKNANSKKFVEGYYEALISLLGHKILQSQKTDKKSLYLVEVFNRKTIAISILPGEEGTTVKLFQRSSGGF